MAARLETSKKRGPGRSSAPKTLSFGVKIVKIGPADSEVICLREIIKKDKKERNYRKQKIYSHSGKFAEQAKLEMRGKAKHIAHLAP